MTRHIRLDEYLVGVEGIALMRHIFEDDMLAAKRIEEVRHIVSGSDEITSWVLTYRSSIP